MCGILGQRLTRVLIVPMLFTACGGGNSGADPGGQTNVTAGSSARSNGGSHQSSGGASTPTTTQGSLGGSAHGATANGGTVAVTTIASGGTVAVVPAGGVTSSSGTTTPSGNAGGRADGGSSVNLGGLASGGKTSGTGGILAAGRSAVSAGSTGMAGSNSMGGVAGVIANRDGIWQGTTAQGRPIRFAVVSGIITYISVGWIESSASGTNSQRAPALTLTNTGTVSGATAGSPVSYKIAGQLTASDGSGTLDFHYMSGDAIHDFAATWTATRVGVAPVCGNNIPEWPETCDEGNLTNNDGCSDACLLEGTAEQEPNDDGETAVGQDDFSTAALRPMVDSNAMVTGSLIPAGDEDAFRVFNVSYTSAVTVRIETFGRGGEGTCDVDTVLILRDKTGIELVRDDDSGVGNCSSITYTIPGTLPTTMIYAHVMDKGDDSAVGLYFVKVTYL